MYMQDNGHVFEVVCQKLWIKYTAKCIKFIVSSFIIKSTIYQNIFNAMKFCYLQHIYHSDIAASFITVFYLSNISLLFHGGQYWFISYQTHIWTCHIQLLQNVHIWLNFETTLVNVQSFKVNLSDLLIQ